MFFKPQSCVGIAIGHNRLQLVTIAKKKKALVITGLAAACGRALCMSLREILPYCMAKKAVLSIPLDMVLQKNMSIAPALTALELEYEVKNTLSRIIPQYEQGDFFDFSRQKTEPSLLTVVVVKQKNLGPFLESLNFHNIAVETIRIATPSSFSHHPEKLPALFLPAYHLALQGF